MRLDSINLELSDILQSFIEGDFDLSARCLPGCVAQVSISPKILAALIARDYRFIDGVATPGKFRAALLAIKRNGRFSHDPQSQNG
jgi:hypothetical protein